MSTESYDPTQNLVLLMQEASESAQDEEFEDDIKDLIKQVIHLVPQRKLDRLEEILRKSNLEKINQQIVNIRNNAFKDLETKLKSSNMKMYQGHQGRCLILNYTFQKETTEKEFDTQPQLSRVYRDRSYSLNDVKAIKVLMNRYGIQITEKANLSTQATKDALSNWIQDLLANKESLKFYFVFIMSHGDEDHIQTMGADPNENISVRDIMSILLPPDLNDLSKVLIFQACRGSGSNRHLTTATTQQTNNFARVPVKYDGIKTSRLNLSEPNDNLGVNYLRIFPTLPGCKAAAVSEGTFLIKAVTNAITRHNPQHVLCIGSSFSNLVAAGIKESHKMDQNMQETDIKHEQFQEFYLPPWDYYEEL